MIERIPLQQPTGLRKIINDAYHADEATIIRELIQHAGIGAGQTEAAQAQARVFIETIRQMKTRGSGIDAFLTEYALSTEEGIALMCLAEAFLRVPDKDTVDALIKDKIISQNWGAHKGKSESFYVNATTLGLIFTGKILKPSSAENLLKKSLSQFINRSSESFIRKAVYQAMRIMSRQFVTGRTIQEALSRAKKLEAEGFSYSYDMLGEAALTVKDADLYFSAYEAAIDAIGKAASGDKLSQRPGISIKLSALYPRYFEQQHHDALAVLSEKLLSLCKKAKAQNIGLTVDAEEAERLDLSLDIFEKVYRDPALTGWEGLGLALQSYQKRAFFVLDWLASLAREEKRRIMLRLIKGAYWDTEIKYAQVQGLKDYPVFTRKSFTDVSFQACARKILTMTDAFYPQFATHNAYSTAMILEMAGNYRDFEFQCLHGMGTELYSQIVPKDKMDIPCRIYAPVGSHEDLLPYLVRRLLENGANSSFVNRVVDSKTSVDEMLEDPVKRAEMLCDIINQNIPLPDNVFQPLRKNSRGMDLTDRAVRADLQQKFASLRTSTWRAHPTTAMKSRQDWQAVYSPSDRSFKVGEVAESSAEDIEAALSSAVKAFQSWGMSAVETRAACLERAADLLEEQYEEFMALACFEAGKTLSDGIAEVREAADFCRYYAAKARELQAEPQCLPGYTGERNELSLHPRGTVLCISPWNFPLAIFTGQVVAALVTGNCVIAKPAEQTPLIAAKMVEILKHAGIPDGVLHLLPGTGEAVAAPLVKDTRIKAVMFTGSTETATKINRSLAGREGEIIPLIAETGGQNTMIVDSSALLEQVTVDVLISAFGSAGQRCSALRVLYVQEDIYPRLIEMIQGAMAELKVGNPAFYSTDIGPVIDQEAFNTILQHIEKMKGKYDIIYQAELHEECSQGTFVPPTAIAIDSIKVLEREVFGPVLHVIPYQRDKLNQVIDDINSTKYGLTYGIHSRVNKNIAAIRERIHAGNGYVNRSMTGAIVGLQPFGGEGLSGTGPKAGGPYYLLRLCHERAYTENTTAAGGNASLMAMAEV